jgi:mannose-6-phosphate isomerase
MELLTNPVRTYPWGSTTAIPELLGVAPNGQHQAELWIGAHERAPSSVVRGAQRVGLHDVIAADPMGQLGPADGKAPRLPFMAKILAVDEPLSLQVHPGRDQAASGFAKEEAAGLARDSGLRNYPDARAKPELILALSEYSLICGLSSSADALELLDALHITELKPMANQLMATRRDGVLPALSTVLRTGADVAGPWIDAVLPAAARLADGSRWGPAATAFLTVATRYPTDPASLATLLLRSHVLSPGQALFVAPGQPHSHLSGFGVEVLANSDNIVRTGLTGKHTDPDQWLDLVQRSAGLLPDLELPGEQDDVEIVYAPPVAEFALGVVTEARSATRLADISGPQLLCCLRGLFEVFDGATTISLPKGAAAFVPAKADFVETSGAGTLLRVTKGRYQPADKVPKGGPP